MILSDPTYRVQYGADRELVSEATATECSEPIITRQEFKDEADLNILLARFGVNTPVRQMVYGSEVDYNLDLQQALAAIEAAQRANFMVPDEIRHKYPDWRSVLNGAERGEYQHDLQELADRKEAEKEKQKQTPID